eukprot:s1158_g8.t3
MNGSLDAGEILTEGFETAIRENARQIVGSSTACIASLDCSAGELEVANLGDSGALVVQPNGHVCLETKEQQHYFNCPYQLVCVPPRRSGGSAMSSQGDLPASSDKYATDVRPGDVLILATDGFFDNVWKEQAVSVVLSMASAPAAEIADRLVRVAYAASQSLNETPFGRAAAQHGIRHKGGKPDDITVLCWGSPEIDRDEDLVERQVLLQHGGPLSCEFTEDPVDWPSLLAALRGVAANFSHSSVMITAVQLQEHFEADKGRDVRLDGCFLGLLAVRLMSVYVSGAHHHMFLRASQDWMVHQGFNDFMALPFVNVLKSPFVHSTVAALGAYSRQTREACPALRGPPGIQSEWEAKQFGHLWCFMTEGSPPMVMKVQGANLASPWCGVQELELRTSRLRFRKYSGEGPPEGWVSDTRTRFFGVWLVRMRWGQFDPMKPRDEEEWKAELPPEVFEVLREKVTEPRGSGEYNTFFPKTGHFQCAGCSTPLYSPESKIKAHCGWPAFSKCYTLQDAEGLASVVAQVDWSAGGREILCRSCGGDTPERHCVNSLSVAWVEEPKALREVLCDMRTFDRQLRDHSYSGTYSGEPLAPASPYTGFVRRASDEQATRVLQPLWQAAEEALSQRRPTRRLAVATHAYFSQQTVACAEAEATASLAAAWIGQLPHMFAVSRAQDSLKDLSFLQATYTRWPVWDLMMQMAARPTAGLTDGLQPSSCISLEPCRRTVTFYRRLRMQLGSELLECPEASDALALSYRHGLLRLESNYSELIRLRGNNLPELLLLDITRVLQRMGMEDMENSHAWVSKYVVQRAVSVEELPVRLGWEGMRISSPIHRFGDVHIEPQRLGPRKRARRSRLPFGFSDRRASVYILIVESASRTAFEAFCPKTMAFLRRQSRLERPVRADEESPNSRKWRVVDLALFHALYGGTVANMVPALTGFSFDMAKDSERRAGWRCETVLEGIPEGRLLWNIAKKHGYKTLFGATGCNGFLGTRYCRKWLGQFDRVVPSLEIDPNCHSQHEWRAMMLERKGKRGCIGGKRPSEHLLDYFLRFQEIHSDGPVFAYLHLEASAEGLRTSKPASHESQHALQLLDEALAAHLEGLSRLPPEARPLLVLAGDHGPPNECDEKSPLVSFLVPEARLPDMGCGGLLTNCGLPHLQSNLTGTLRRAAEENARLWRRYMWNLEQNRFVISSWYDVYATLRHIISGKDPGGAAQNELQWDAPDHRARSLLSKLPRRRTCTQAGVPEWHCGCARTWVGYCPLSKRGQWAIAVRALEEVNQLVEAAGPKFRVDSVVCRPMQLEQLLNCEMHLPSYQRIQHNLQGKGKEDRTIIRLRMLTTHGMEFEFYVYMRFKSLSGNLQDVEGYVDEFLKLFPRSRYRPNEHCTPTNLDPAFCACGDEAELRKRPAIDEDLPT